MDWPLFGWAVRLALPAHPMPMTNKGGRPKGSGNPFLKGDLDIHGVVRDFYGPSAYKIAIVRRKHIEDGCHTCMKEAEDRMYGRPPQEIKHTGRAQAPIVLIAPAIPQPQLEEETPIDVTAVEVETQTDEPTSLPPKVRELRTHRLEAEDGGE